MKFLPQPTYFPSPSLAAARDLLRKEQEKEAARLSSCSWSLNPDTAGGAFTEWEKRNAKEWR